MIEEHEVDSAVDFLRDKASEAAQKRATREYLEEFKKSKRAMLRLQSNGTTEGAKDDFAYSHPEYLELLDGLRVAIEQDEEIRFLARAAETKITAWQTQVKLHLGMKI